MRALIFGFLLCTCMLWACTRGEGDTLRLVHVFFRHGSRTPEFKDTYPNDIYKADTFQPMGYGQLTNHGKGMAYQLGQNLRRRYNDFLGDIYNPELVYAQSTDFDRTKMSALLALAGLFPPSASQQWNDQLPWLPIPVSYEKHDSDYWLRRPNKYCPIYMKELSQALQSEEALLFMKKHKKTFEYLTEKTGKPIQTLSDVFGVYQTLKAEETMNLTLPEWTHEVYPEPVTEIAAKQCEFENSNLLLKKFNGGRMLSKVIKQMSNMAKGELKPLGRKIYLYSGHENNVINVLAALNLFETHFPNYSSAVIIELHNLGKKNGYAVKIFYGRDINEELEELQLEGCDVLCPLEQFIEITSPQVPKNFTAECHSELNLD